ncbi:uncharacterized protein LOC141788618 [Halichoeres trimaculatus]|uniref:uncharacterized protein LOC141788618 n=1 Tax=Halichoeres trimaculatus TaxID=147232 RepID=UPI003D9F2C7F
MADPSKSSQKAKNVVIGLLALWSIISLIVIVVWSTSPDLKGSARCHADLQEATEKLEGVKVVCKKDKVALEEQVEAERAKQERQRAQIAVLLGNLDAINRTLEESRQENLVLQANVSVLQENITQLLLTEANLTAQISLQEDQIDALEQNLTQAAHQTETCAALRAAAESQMLAAQSQHRACESGQQYLKKQLLKCKLEDSEAPQQTQQKQEPPTPTPSSDASPLCGIPALTLLVCSALRLIT